MHHAHRRGYDVRTSSGVVVVRAKLVKIGNSRVIRLAKPLLEVAGLADDVEIEAAPGILTIRPSAHPRAGWAEAAAALRLRLHPSKTHLHRTVSGASFVGFHVIGGRIRLRNPSLLRIRRGLRRCAWAVAQRRISTERAFVSAQSWDAHLAHGHTLALRRRLFAPHAFARGLPAPALLA